MAVKIAQVDVDSIAEECEILPGETLISINKNNINDVLDYRFYMTDEELDLLVLDKDGNTRIISIEKEEYEDLGLEFETYLMDKQIHCKNKCIFCFVDQTPKGMRKSLYFKDDDTRLSFLFGNYVTLTNLKDSDIERIIKFKITPVNISVHTTNPELRSKMMGNPNAGKCLRYIKQLTDGGIDINTQLVLCPGINDGEELIKTLTDLENLFPHLQSVAAVPIGITKFREGLFPLRPYTKEEATEVVNIFESFSNRFLKKYGKRFVYPSDEFFLLAEKPIPGPSYYGDFGLLENGVGMITLLRKEFGEAMEDACVKNIKRTVTTITGVIVGDLLKELAKKVEDKWDNIKINVVPIVNHFFGETITVTGLVTGQDIISQLKGRDLGDELIIPDVMLRNEKDLFLDDYTVDDIEKALNISVRLSENDGYKLLESFTGQDDIYGY